MTSLQNLPKNVEDLGKLNVAKGFKKLPKIQNIAKSGHTALDVVIVVVSVREKKDFFQPNSQWMCLDFSH